MCNSDKTNVWGRLSSLYFVPIDMTTCTHVCTLDILFLCAVCFIPKNNCVKIDIQYFH